MASGVAHGWPAALLEFRTRYCCMLGDFKSAEDSRVSDKTTLFKLKWSQSVSVRVEMYVEDIAPSIRIIRDFLRRKTHGALWGWILHKFK